MGRGLLFHSSSNNLVMNTVWESFPDPFRFHATAYYPPHLPLAVLGSDSGFASSSQTDSASWSLEDDVKVHTENTGEGVILDTQINVFLNTESKVSCYYETKYQCLRS